MGIFPYIGLINSRYLQFWFLKWPLTWIFPYRFLTTMHVPLLVVTGIRSPYQPSLHHSTSFWRISTIEGSLELRSQTSDNIARRKKAEVGRVSQRRKSREKARRSEKRQNQKKEDADARKGKKVANHSVFQMICGSGGSKSRLAKAAGAEPSGQMRDEKVHTVVARSTFPSQNVQRTPWS